MQKQAWELNFCRETFSLLERFYKKWTIFWPRPGHSRPDTDNTGPTRRAKSGPNRDGQTCTNHDACAQHKPRAGQMHARPSTSTASQTQPRRAHTIAPVYKLSHQQARRMPDQARSQQARSKLQLHKTLCLRAHIGEEHARQNKPAATKTQTRSKQHM